MKKVELNQPEFLLCEIPIKDGSINDNRNWVYHRLSLSLIEFVNVDDFEDFQLNNASERFEFKNSDGFIENYFAVFVQNNCYAVGENPKNVLESAWEFYKSYLIWEDKNIDNDNFIKNN